MKFHVDNAELFSVKSKKAKTELQHFSRTEGSHCFVKAPAVNQDREHFGSINFQALRLNPAFSKNRSHNKP